MGKPSWGQQFKRSFGVEIEMIGRKIIKCGVLKCQGTTPAEIHQLKKYYINS